MLYIISAHTVILIGIISVSVDDESNQGTQISQAVATVHYLEILMALCLDGLTSSWAGSWIIIWGIFKVSSLSGSQADRVIMGSVLDSYRLQSIT